MDGVFRGVKDVNQPLAKQIADTRRSFSIETMGIDFPYAGRSSWRDNTDRFDVVTWGYYAR